MTDAFVGIDVSASGLALAVHQSDYHFECALDSSSTTKLIDEVKKLQPKLIALEASHLGTEIPIAAALHAAGLPTVVVNATTVNRFAQMDLVEGKRAEVLARFAAHTNRKPTSASADANQIKALLNRRAQLVETLNAERERQQTSESISAREIASHVFEIQRRIAGVDFQLKKHLRDAGVWQVKSKLSQSVPAIALSSFAFAAAAVLLVLPLWIVKYPPLLDYPNHLARIFILTHINDPNYQFSQYYTVTFGPYPYLTMDVLLMGLQKVFSFFTGGRIILSLGATGVPLAAWFFVRQANRENTSLACWALLSGYNIFFLWGFVNWQLSMALVLLAAGLWIRYLTRPTIVRWLALLLIVTVIYFTHLQGFGFAGLIITAYAALTQKGLRSIARALVQGWTLFLPGSMLHLITRITTRETTAAWAMNFHPLSDKWDRLYFFVQGYSPRLDTITLLVLLGCAVAARWRNREFKWNHPWPAILAGLFLLYWIFPGYGVNWAGDDADVRLLPFIFMLLPAVIYAGRRARWLALVACLLFCARSANVIRTFRAEQPELIGMARAFSLTPANARVLPVIESRDDEPQLRPYAHFWAYGIIDRGWFSTYLLTIKNVTTVQVKSNLARPDGFWDLEYQEDPVWDKVADDYDYVWAFHVPQYNEDLDEIADKVYESGDLRLYRIKKDREKDDDDEDKSP
jgi:ribosomal protein L9